jgi:hypothetical protein
MMWNSYYSTERVIVSQPSIADVSATLDSLSSNLFDDLTGDQQGQASLTQAVSVMAMAARAIALDQDANKDATNATAVIMDRIISLLYALPSVYADEAFTLMDAATAASAVASVTEHVTLVGLESRYTALQALSW